MTRGLMNRYVQLDDDKVTAYLEARTAPSKDLPAGRAFVQVPEGAEMPAFLSTLVRDKDAPGDLSKATFREPPAPPDYGRAVDPREFLLLFTQAERIQIRAAAAADPQVADWYDVFRVPTPIRLKHPTTLQGLQALVAKNLLTAARRDAIIAS